MKSLDIRLKFFVSLHNDEQKFPSSISIKLVLLLALDLKMIAYGQTFLVACQRSIDTQKRSTYLSKPFLLFSLSLCAWKLTGDLLASDYNSGKKKCTLDVQELAVCLRTNSDSEFAPCPCWLMIPTKPLSSSKLLFLRTWKVNFSVSRERDTDSDRNREI